MYENAVREKEGVIGKLALLEEGRRRLVDENNTAEQKHREDADVSVSSTLTSRGAFVYRRVRIKHPPRIKRPPPLHVEVTAQGSQEV